MRLLTIKAGLTHQFAKSIFYAHLATCDKSLKSEQKSYRTLRQKGSFEVKKKCF